ncbi:MAG: hypothetical protein U0234_26750 [Sandaracinus sp.]
MLTRSLGWLVPAVSLAACQTPTVYPMLSLDASADAPRGETGPIRVRDSGPRDTGATSVDTGNVGVDVPVVETDAGLPIAIQVDGLFTEPYWNGGGGSDSLNTTTALSPFTGDAITTLHYGRDAHWLYLGFEGTLVSGDAVVFWVDTPGATGVLLTPIGLSDRSNVVNTVLSLGLSNDVVDFQPQLGWGASLLPHGRVASDSTLGWRTLASGSAFGVVRDNTTSACSASGCETAILLDQVGVLPGELLQLVVRLGRPEIGFSNQAFPTIDGPDPSYITDTVVVPVAP